MATRGGDPIGAAPSFGGRGIAGSARWNGPGSRRPDSPDDRPPSRRPPRDGGHRAEVTAMGRDEILAFLEAIDAELVEHAGEGERLDLYLI